MTSVTPLWCANFPLTSFFFFFLFLFFFSFFSFCVESIPAQVNSGCAVDQRAAWCPGRLVSALMFLNT